MLGKRLGMAQARAEALKFMHDLPWVVLLCLAMVKTDLHIRIHGNSWEFYGNSLQAPLPCLRECQARSQSSEAAQEQEAGRQDDTDDTDDTRADEPDHSTVFGPSAEAFSVGCL